MVSKSYLLLICAVILLLVLVYPSSARSGDPTPTATMTPSLTPTPSPLITVTPSAPAVCPLPTGKQAALPTADTAYFDTNYEFLPDPMTNYLNTTGEAQGLKTALEQTQVFSRTQVKLTDVTGDHVPDVTVSLTYVGMYGATLDVFTCKQGSYVNVFNRSYADESRDFIWDKNVTGILAVHDLNGNGLPDILFDYLPNIGTHGYGYLDYSILEWNGDKFVELTEQHHDDPYDHAGLTSFNLVKHDLREHGNGTYELVITSSPAKDFYYGGSEAERTLETIYAWNGVAFTHFCVRYIDPPKYLADAVMDGDNETNCRHLDQAMRLYQQAIFSSGLLPWNNLQAYGSGHCCINYPTATADPQEKPPLEAYARYRIILLHVVQNRLNEAKTDYDILQSKFPAGVAGHQFTALAAAFWQGYQAKQSVQVGCQQAIDYARTHAEITDAFARYAYFSEISWNAFGLSDHIEEICPFK